MYSSPDGTRYNRHFEKVPLTKEEKIQKKETNKRISTFNKLKKALVRENMTKFKTFLETCEDPNNIYDCNGDPIIETAINLANQQAITMLINRGVSVNVKTFDNKTCLTVAYSSPTLLELVLNKLDSEVSEKIRLHFINTLYDNDDNTPLLLVFKYGSKTMIDLILKHGGDMYDQQFMKRFLSKDIQSDEYVKRLEKLLHFGFDVNKIFEFRYNLLTDAVEHRCIEAVKVLIEHGADTEATTLGCKSTPLLVSVKKQDLLMMNVLLDHGCHIGSTNLRNDNALLVLTKTMLSSLHIQNHDIVTRVQTCAQIMQTLIEKGCNVNHVDKDGLTPIMPLCRCNFDTSELVKILISHGASLTHCNNHMRSVAMHACCYGDGNINVVKLLQENNVILNMNDFEIRLIMKSASTKQVYNIFETELRWRARKDVLLVKKKSPVFSKMPDEVVRKVACYLDYEDWNTFFKVKGRRR